MSSMCRNYTSLKPQLGVHSVNIRAGVAFHRSRPRLPEKQKPRKSGASVMSRPGVGPGTIGLKVESGAALALAARMTLAETPAPPLADTYRDSQAGLRSIRRVLSVYISRRPAPVFTTIPTPLPFGSQW